MKLIASDIDGTVLPLGELEIDPRLFEAIKKLDPKKAIFVVASGRNHNNIKKLFLPVADEVAILSENGTAVWNEDELIATIPIERELVQTIIDKLSTIPNLEMYITTPTGGYIIPKDRERAAELMRSPIRQISLIESIDEIEGPIVKVTAFCYPDSKTYFQTLKDLFKDDGVEVAIGGPNVVDVTVGNKGAGLKKLAETMGVGPEDIYAFGDNYNDISMLNYAGNSYIVETDDPELKAAARYSTKDVIGEIEKLAEEFKRDEAEEN